MEIQTVMTLSSYLKAKGDGWRFEHAEATKHYTVEGEPLVWIIGGVVAWPPKYDQNDPRFEVRVLDHFNSVFQGEHHLIRGAKPIAKECNHAH